MTIAYVESNFLLELARQQEEAASAERILTLAESGRIALVFSTLAICEPFSTLTYYGIERRRSVETMERVSREVQRLAPHRETAEALTKLSKSLLSIAISEMDGLERTVSRMLAFGRCLPIDQATFKVSQEKQSEFGLSPQDALIYASILIDLQKQPTGVQSIFVSQNPKDFKDASIVAELRNLGCRYMSRFSHAVDYLTGGAWERGSTGHAAVSP